MSHLVTINNTALSPIEFRGERVLTFKMIDKIHTEEPTNGLVNHIHQSKAEGRAKKNFANNRTHFILDEDYFIASMKEARQLAGVHSPNGLTLLTESGYLLLAKTLNDKQAWSIQKTLIRTYFRAKDLEVPVQQEIVMHQPEVVKSSEIAQMQQAMIAMTTGLTASMAKMADSMAHIAQAMQQGQHNASKEPQGLKRVNAPYAMGKGDVIIMDAENMSPCMQELSKIMMSCGGASALAALVGLERQYIYGWKKRGRVPPGMIPELKRQFPWVSVEALLTFRKQRKPLNDF